MKFSITAYLLFFYVCFYSCIGLAEDKPKICVEPGIFFTTALHSYYRNFSWNFTLNFSNGNSVLDDIGYAITRAHEVQAAMRAFFEYYWAEDISHPESRMRVLDREVAVSVGGRDCTCEIVSGVNFVRNAKTYVNRQALATIGTTPEIRGGDWYYLVVNKTSLLVEQTRQDSARFFRDVRLRLLWHGYMNNNSVKAIRTALGENSYELDIASFGRDLSIRHVLDDVARQNPFTNPPLPLDQKLLGAVVSQSDLALYREERGPVFDNNLTFFYLPAQLPNVLLCPIRSSIRFTERPFYDRSGNLTLMSAVGRPVGLSIWNNFRPEIFFPRE